MEEAAAAWGGIFGLLVLVFSILLILAPVMIWHHLSLLRRQVRVVEANLQQANQQLNALLSKHDTLLNIQAEAHNIKLVEEF